MTFHLYACPHSKNKRLIIVRLMVQFCVLYGWDASQKKEHSFVIQRIDLGTDPRNRFKELWKRH